MFDGDIDIFASGIYFPNKQDGQDWYNLCSLPLIPLKTGSTQVYIERPGADSDYPLTLYAKHDPEADENYKPAFDITTVNGGYHTINIKDKLIPSAPTANYASGTYKEKVEVKLQADSDCTIYWKTNAADQQWKIYSYPNQESSTINPIVIDYTQSIICKAVRTAGLAEGEPKRESREVQYDYTIVPDSPYLWNDSKATIIISQLYKDNAFTVYPSHKNDTYAGEIANDRAFYYTFDETLTVADLPDGTDFAAEEQRNAKTQWKKLTNNNPEIDITENVTLRIIARKNAECSDIAEFDLGIKPAPAIDPNYTDGDCTSVSAYTVELTSTTSPVEIYYTTNGANPITDGIYYQAPFAITADTDLRTVAKIPGMDNYSEIKLYSYNFVDNLINAFYPAGTYRGSVSVALSAVNAAAIEYFVADGDADSTVSADDARFVSYNNSKITVTKNQTIYAKVSGETEVYSFPYTVKPLKPQFSPASRQFVGAGNVDVSAANVSTDDVKYTLYYTTDGSNPTDANNANRQSVSATDTGNLPAAHILVGNAMTIKAVVYADYGEYSDVVTHEYDTVSDKPEKPTTTLAPGYYTLENAHSLSLETAFAEAPEGVEIYYTVSRNGEAVSAPYPGVAGTVHYDGTPIDIYGNTVIKAVAIDENGVRSDIGTFTYTVVPESPIAAPSGTADALKVIPVTTVAGAEVTYKITGTEGDKEVTFTLPEAVSTFYINPDDGLPYREQECTTPLTSTETSMPFSESIDLSIVANVNGVSSQTANYSYTVDTTSTPVLAPYPDKPQGTYNETKNAFVVKLFSQTPGAAIYYNIVNGTDGEQVYDADEGITLSTFTILRCYAKDTSSGEVSQVKTYVYNFKPLPPVFKYESGTYDSISDNCITFNTNSPAYDYTIMRRYRYGDDVSTYTGYTPDEEFGITKNAHVMAYVLNNDTGEISEITEKHYIIRDAADINPYVKVRAPYDAASIARSKLSEAEYVNGIKLDLLVGNYTTHYIKYKYSYKLKNDSNIYSTNWNVYDPDMPILVNTSMEYIDIEAQVYRNNETDPMSVKYTHHIDFTGDSTTTVYVSSGGGGGGSYVVDKTKKYTKDIFGNEHPTHVGYISGYVDGSVRPEGNITREEIVAILYRISNKEYDEPFVLTGGVFPDVTKSRWSVLEIEYMFDKGVVSGYPDGEFKPEQNLSRAEFAALVSRFAKLEASANAKNTFADLKENHWAYDNIMALCEAGLMVGYDDGTFGADNEITRAEVIVVINKILGRNPSESYVKSLNLKPFNDLDKNKWYYVDVLEATVTHNYTLDQKDVEVEWEGYN